MVTFKYEKWFLNVYMNNNLVKGMQCNKDEVEELTKKEMQRLEYAYLHTRADINERADELYKAQLKTNPNDGRAMVEEIQQEMSGFIFDTKIT